MLNILSLKKKQKTTASAGTTSKVTAAQIRIQKDISELDSLPPSLVLSFPNENDIFNILLLIKPDEEGFYQNGSFPFTIKISNQYPHEPPKVLSTKKIYHPNIDYQGNVCLNILREDWKPVLSLHAVIIGLQYLFLEPNPDDPLNKGAAEVLRRDRSFFSKSVLSAMKGGVVDGEKYDRVIN